MSIHHLFDTNNSKSYPQERYKDLVNQQPSLRRRDIAEKLKISEAELIDQQLGIRSLRLKEQFSDIIPRLSELGYIMSLTRNKQAVHEKKGTYSNISIQGAMGLVISKDKKIDLRIFLKQWKYGFAVEEKVKDNYRYSLQFFDTEGTAIQKIYLQENSNLEAYKEIVEKFSDQHNKSSLNVIKSKKIDEFTTDSEVDIDSLKKHWFEMRDVHQFMGILKKFKVSREQAFRLVGQEFAEPFSPKKLERILQQIVDKQLSIMCFVGNQGNIQIHTGPINKVKKINTWLNILDPEFNLHLVEDEIQNAWLVRKPTADGIITSLEFYNNKGENIVQFFGQRQEGNPENKEWRSIAESALS